MNSPHTALATLVIDLDAVGANWHKLNQISKDGAPQSLCGAVVKANGYGLGLGPVAQALYRAGARVFFVATPDEALNLRQIFDRNHIPPQEAKINILAGLVAGLAPLYHRHHLTPVLNSLHQLKDWRQEAQRQGKDFPALLQFDSGMARLGLDQGEQRHLCNNRDLLYGAGVTHYLHHYACADQPDHPLTCQQLARFQQAICPLPAAQHSLANSAACFLDRSFRGTLTRPGYALYGGNPIAHDQIPPRHRMTPVIQIATRILQVRRIDAGTHVGYGATYTTKVATRLATVHLGYADGLLRTLSNKGTFWFRGTPLPIRGRVSMDSVIVDVSEVPEQNLHEGDWLNLLGPEQGIDQLAQEAGTIGYELLTLLGQRTHRTYKTTHDATSHTGGIA